MHLKTTATWALVNSLSVKLRHIAPGDEVYDPTEESEDTYMRFDYVQSIYEELQLEAYGEFSVDAATQSTAPTFDQAIQTEMTVE